MTTLTPSSLFSKTLTTATTNPQTTRLTLSALSTVFLALVIPKTYRDYKTFISYGPGGLTNNVFGWLGVTIFLRPLGREMLDTVIYDRNTSSDIAKTSLLLDIPDRKGERPVVGPHPVPQRQLSGIPERAVKDKLMDEFNSFAARNTGLVKLAPSHLERHTDAIWIAYEDTPSSRWTEMARRMRGEIAHLHGHGDFSGHVTLSPADCKKVIESGWGQRHAFSGSWLITPLTLGRVPRLPAEYVLIYAPRDEDEIETVLEIFAAGVEYMTGSRMAK